MSQIINFTVTQKQIITYLHYTNENALLMFKDHKVLHHAIQCEYIKWLLWLNFVLGVETVFMNKTRLYPGEIYSPLVPLTKSFRSISIK